VSDIRSALVAAGIIRPGVAPAPRADGLTEFKNLLGLPLMVLPFVRTPPEPPPEPKRKRTRRRRRHPGES
jgi:hypothetical protein